LEQLKQTKAFSVIFDLKHLLFFQSLFSPQRFFIHTAGSPDFREMGKSIRQAGKTMGSHGANNRITHERIRYRVFFFWSPTKCNSTLG